MTQHLKTIFFAIVLLTFPILSFAGERQNLNGKAKLNIMFVVDGLRPDLINAEDTPNIFHLMQAGVFFENSHAIFPTVTRVNSAAIATASYPVNSGIVSNSIFIPAMDTSSSFTTGDYRNLAKLDNLTNGKLLLNKTWVERLIEHDLEPAVISSGSTGSAYLMNHLAPKGSGVLINGWFEPDSIVAFPTEINNRILQKIGPAPDVSGDKNYNEKVNWTTRVFTDYLLQEERPDVIFCWVTEPDHTQHRYGIGAPETIETIRNSDRNIGLIIQKIKDIGLESETNIFVTSDHGFSTYNYKINVEDELINAGLKKSHLSGDVVLASSGQSVLIHVKDRNKKKIEDIAEYFLNQEWIDIVFTSGKGTAPKQFQGWVSGTFSLQLLHLPVDGRGPDLLITFPWSSEKNKFGFQGMDYASGGGTTGQMTGNAGGHGSLSPWTIRNTMIAWGADFKSGVRNKVPAASIDFTATILALLNIPLDNNIQGRILHEALKNGVDIHKVPIETKNLTIRHEKRKTTIQISVVEDHWYIDKGWSTKMIE